MSDTACKVLFGMWAVLTASWALASIGGAVAGSPSLDRIMVAVCGANVCMLLWDRWHARTAVRVTRFDFNIADLVDGEETAATTRREG